MAKSKRRRSSSSVLDTPSNPTKVTRTDAGGTDGGAGRGMGRGTGRGAGPGAGRGTGPGASRRTSRRGAGRGAAAVAGAKPTVLKIVITPQQMQTIKGRHADGEDSDFEMDDVEPEDVDMDDDFERYEEPRARKTGKGWNKGKKNNDDDDYIDAQERKTRKKIQAKAHTKAQRGKKKGKKDEIPYEPLLPSHLVPAPSPEFLNQGFLFYPESQIRSPEALLQRFIANGYGRGLKCHKYAPVIQLPFTLEDLEANRLSYAELEEVCIELDKKEAQAMSAKFVDKNGRTLVYYCSRRQKSLSSQTIKFEDQYKNRTQKDLDAIPRQHIVHDGLDPDNPVLSIYYAAVQKLCSILQPVLPKSDRRHTRTPADLQPHIMKYTLRDYAGLGVIHRERRTEVLSIIYKWVQRNEVTTAEERTGVLDYAGLGVVHSQYRTEVLSIIYKWVRRNEVTTAEERTGVLHLVHAWIQQNQPAKGLYASKLFTSSTNDKLAALREYYMRSEPVMLVAGRMLRAFEEHFYEIYRESFDAGVWEQEDVGPFLARAIVYKAQVELHRDNNDEGVAMSFPSGYFTGGAMLFPELGLKLAYNKGDVIVSYAGRLTHKVTNWKPSPHYPPGVTPGRVGTVFFFPKHSLDQLRGKPYHWGIKTGYGRYDCNMQFAPRRIQEMDGCWEESDMTIDR